jgi:phosphatidylserine decarboxylase
MSATLDQWIEEIAPFKTLEPDVMNSLFFFRDPSRPYYIDSDYIFSPADGVVLHQSFCKPDENMVEMKGIKYSPRDILEDKEFKETSLCISIFMTMYDVHINRMPTNGNVYTKQIAPMQTKNMPMLFEERDLLEGHVNYKNMNYPTKNGRTVNTVFNGNYKYFIVQICDSDVNVIAPFSTVQGKHYSQNERFSVVRYGSQVTVVLPLTDSFEFDLCEKPEMHVRAGLDKLVYLRSKNDYNMHMKSKKVARKFSTEALPDKGEEGELMP